MATNLDIIKRAMKKLHVLASGGVPSSAEAADGMNALQALIIELIGQGSLGRLNDVLATSAYTAREFERISYPTSVTITLPTTITDTNCNDYGFVDNDYHAYYSSSPRPPIDRAVIVKVNSTTGIPIYYVWCAYKAAWVAINALTQQGDFPFAQYLEDGFAALLAERLVDEFDQQLGAETKRQANACRVMLAQKRDSQPRNTSSHSQYM